MNSEQKLRYIVIEQMTSQGFQNKLNAADADGYELFTVSIDAEAFYAVMVYDEAREDFDE